MLHILTLIIYWFINPYNYRDLNKNRISEETFSIDSTILDCASKSARITFAGKENYLGEPVEYTAFVIAEDILIVRYLLTVREEVLWVTNKKSSKSPIIYFNNDYLYDNPIRSEFILIHKKYNRIQCGSKYMSEYPCLSVINGPIVSKYDNTKETYLELNYKFIQFFYGLSTGGGLKPNFKDIHTKSFWDYFTKHIIPENMKNRHALVRFLKTEKEICNCDSIKFCYQPLTMEIYSREEDNKIDTGVIYFPCPERYFENTTDSFKLTAVVLKTALDNNRYEIDTSDVPVEMKKFVFLGLSNEIIKINNE